MWKKKNWKYVRSINLSVIFLRQITQLTLIIIKLNNDTKITSQEIKLLILIFIIYRFARKIIS